MRNLLLASTAAFALAGVAGSALAAEVSTKTLGLQISGEFQFNFGISDEDQVGTGANQVGEARSTDFETNSEIEFTFTNRADNGLTYGANLELEADPNDAGHMDEVYGFVSGGFGQIEFGNEDGAADKQLVTIPTGFGTGGVDGDFGGFIVGDAPNVTIFPTDTSDSTKVSYYSPSFSGLTVGISYTPRNGSEGDNVSLLKTGTGFEDVVELGVNYRGEFQGVSVAVGGVYSFGDGVETAAGATSNTEDLSAYAVGASVGFSGVTIGAIYVDNQESGLTVADPSKTDNTAYGLGIQYTTGPITVGAQYTQDERDANAAGTGDVESTAWALGGTYVVAPGLAVYAEGVFWERDSDVAGDDNEGNVFIVGSKINF